MIANVTRTLIVTVAVIMSLALSGCSATKTDTSETLAVNLWPVYNTTYSKQALSDGSVTESDRGSIALLVNWNSVVKYDTAGTITDMTENSGFWPFYSYVYNQDTMNISKKTTVLFFFHDLQQLTPEQEPTSTE